MRQIICFPHISFRIFFNNVFCLYAEAVCTYSTVKYFSKCIYLQILSIYYIRAAHLNCVLQRATHIVPNEINFPRYNMKCSGENVIQRGIFHVVSCFPLHFMLYHGHFNYFSDSVGFVTFGVLALLGLSLIGFVTYWVCHLLGLSHYWVSCFLGLSHYSV